jgi:multidrug efflux pump
MMTTMAAMFAGIPIAIGGGNGSELRRPLGIAIVGGLMVSQMLTLYTTPVIYLYMDRFRAWASGRKALRPLEDRQMDKPELSPGAANEASVSAKSLSPQANS